MDGKDVGLVCDARSFLDATRSGEFSLLEAFLAEHRTSLCRSEWHRGVLPARRAGRLRFHTVGDRWTRSRTARPFGLTRLATLRFVLELLISEKQLFARGPYEIGPAIHTPQGLVLELHRSPPRELVDPVRRSPWSYSDSRRSFLRLRLRASACLALRLSPGFR